MDISSLNIVIRSAEELAAEQKLSAPHQPKSLIVQMHEQICSQVIRDVLII